MASLLQEFTVFLESLSTQPPDVNRYDAVAGFIISKTDIMNRPDWAIATVGCYITIPIWAFAILLSVEIIIARRAYTWASWVTINHGLIRLIAGNWMAFFAVGFGVVTLIEVATELTIPADEIGHSSAAWYAWEAAQFIPFYLFAVSYYMSVASSCLLMSDSGHAGGPSKPAPRTFWGRHGWQILAWFVNISGISAALVACTVIPLFVTLSHRHASAIRGPANTAIAGLRAAAATYTPETFSLGQIITLAEPLVSKAQDGADALYYAKLIWLVWLVLIAYLAVIFIPFSTYHLLALRKAAKAMTRTHNRTTSSAPKRWHEKAMRWLADLNAYHVVLAQILAYHTLIFIHVGLTAWLFVLTSIGQGSHIVPVVGRYVGQLPFATVYILATLFTRRQLALRRSARGGRKGSTPIVAPSGIRVQQIVTRRSSSPDSSITISAKSGLPFAGVDTGRARTYHLQRPIVQAWEMKEGEMREPPSRDEEESAVRESPSPYVVVGP